MFFKNLAESLRHQFGNITGLLWQSQESIDKALVLAGQQLNKQNLQIQVKSLRDVEFRVFSQFGDDGIVAYLTSLLDLPAHLRTFIEFGVQNYRESNTRFLLLSQNWSGLVMDGDPHNISYIRNDGISWMHELKSRQCWITREGINAVIREEGFQGDVGLLHIDLDGNDYWVWESLTVVNPCILILEYNAVFGDRYPVTVPYDEKFDRTSAHYSGQYWGASLGALVALSDKKGYEWIGCNNAGNNAYFVRRDLVDRVSHLLPSRSFVMSKFRDSRDREGTLSLLCGPDRLGIISDMSVFNVETGATVKCGNL